MTKRIAIFAGSFDPITNGHMDMLVQGLNIADEVIVAIGVHAGKQPIFDFEERKNLIEAALREFELDDSRIRIIAFDGLVVDLASQEGASMLLRGLRDSTDLNYEMQMSGMNSTMAPGLNTVFLPASPETRFITATLVRQIAAMNGDITAFVSDVVAQALAERFAKH